MRQEAFKAHPADGETGIHRFFRDSQIEPTAGLFGVTINRPTRMERMEELMNQIIALPPTRPMVDVSPRHNAHGEVLNTGGAITILIRRKKMSVRRVMLSDRAAMTLSEVYE